MRLIHMLSKVNEQSRTIRVLDWLLALGFLGWGLYTQSWIWIGLGGVAVVFAIWSPMAMLARLFPRVVKRTPRQ